MHIEWVWFIK